MDSKTIIRNKTCVVCGSFPTEPAHIKSRGAGGDDAIDNLMSLCRRCHSEQHTIGWITFSKKYCAVKESLLQKGWTVNEQFKKLEKE